MCSSIKSEIDNDVAQNQCNIAKVFSEMWLYEFLQNMVESNNIL